MKQLIHIFNISKNPLFSAVAALATEIMPVSRLSYNPNLINIKSICPLPKMPSYFNKNFNDVALIRAQQMWAELTQDQNINLLWSGGIDSTVALVSLMMTIPNGFQITVYCNLNSIIENAPFYEILLNHKNILLKNSSIISNIKPLRIITGDLGDQVFGSELLYRISSQFGFENLFKPYQEIIPKLFITRCGDNLGKIIYERYVPIIQESSIKIETAFDFIWWWNFTQKWQGVLFRKQCFVHEAHQIIHFFDCENFQLWSLFHHDKKIGKTIETYKLPAKELIFSFDKNDFYLKYKKKLGSPFGNTLYFFGLFDDGSKIYSWNECAELLNSF